MDIFLTHFATFVLLTTIISVNALDEEVLFTSSWAVQIKKEGRGMVNDIADRYGFDNLGQVCLILLTSKFFKPSKQIAGLDDIYHFKLKNSPAFVTILSVFQRGTRSIHNDYYSNRLQNDYYSNRLLKDPYVRQYKT